MSEKIVLVSDPGIDGAFAVSLALFDPNLEVLGLAATPGNVTAEQATHNVHVLIEQLDPPRWPRLVPPRTSNSTSTAPSCTARTAWATPTFPACRCIICRQRKAPRRPGAHQSA